ncbi:YitT family protein [Niallia circulans]|uniref:YitT family protein n=1 Tax=Niallia circulans TaxID=1397 RepID=A0A553SM20_NIACI|nr:YitT family protein [Niallia circulans]TRZ38040.1 YitT family protein [Niallia circulans]
MKKILIMIVGCFFTSIGLYVLKSATLVTGGTAGLSLSSSYLFPISFGVLFTIINIPFYILSYKKMGKQFTISTILAVTTVTILSSLITAYLPPLAFPPLVGSIVGGVIIGAGIVVLFMNGSSLGGAQILSIILQKQFNWNMGKTNFIFDTIVILIGMYSIGVLRGFYSILSVLIVSTMLSRFKEQIAKRNTKPVKVTNKEPLLETSSM